MALPSGGGLFSTLFASGGGGLGVSFLGPAGGALGANAGAVGGSFLDQLLGGQGAGALFRASVAAQVAKSPLAGVRQLLAGAGYNPAALASVRGSSAGTALLNLANQIDALGGWDVVARSGGDLAKTARKTWQYVLTGELVDPKRPIPSTAAVRAALGAAISAGVNPTPLAGSQLYTIPSHLTGYTASGSYWSRMGTVYRGV